MIELYYTFSNPESEAFIKKSLRKYSGKSDFLIRRTETGKPYVDGEIYFSLSHTDGLTVCAVSDKNIGVDAERIREIKNKEKIIARFMEDDVKILGEKEFFEKMGENKF